MRQSSPVAAPKLIVVAGVWLIFAPQLPLLVFGLFLTLSNLIAPDASYDVGDVDMRPISEGAARESLKFLLIIGLLALYGNLLWKVTYRYVDGRHRKRCHARQVCPACGYDLRGTGAGTGIPATPGSDPGSGTQSKTCPECGATT
jgi:hypothetical protein